MKDDRFLTTRSVSRSGNLRVGALAPKAMHLAGAHWAFESPRLSVRICANLRAAHPDQAPVSLIWVACSLGAAGTATVSPRCLGMRQRQLRKRGPLTRKKVLARSGGTRAAFNVRCRTQRTYLNSGVGSEFRGTAKQRARRQVRQKLHLSTCSNWRSRLCFSRNSHGDFEKEP